MVAMVTLTRMGDFSDKTGLLLQGPYWGIPAQGCGRKAREQQGPYKKLPTANVPQYGSS